MALKKFHMCSVPYSTELILKIKLKETEKKIAGVYIYFIFFSQISLEGKNTFIHVRFLKKRSEK